MKQILILTTNPRHDLKLNRETKDLINVIKRSINRSQFETQFGLAVPPEELHDVFLEHEPRIVHFCGLGTEEHDLILQNSSGEEQVVNPDTLSNLFDSLEKKVECVLLDGCYNEVIANAIAQHIKYVIGISQEIRDNAALDFAIGFYRALGWGKSIEESYMFGRNAIQIQIAKANTSRTRRSGVSRNFEALDAIEQVFIPNHLKPVLKQNQNLNLFPEELTSTVGNDAPDSSTQSNFPSKLIEALKKENRYKRYRAKVRGTWDNFGQANVIREAITEEERSQRKILLNKVRQFWIENFFPSASLANSAVDFDWKTSSYAVLSNFDGIGEIPAELDKSFEELQSTDILNQTAQGKILLILGELGSGKTFTLLELAKRLVYQTEQDLTKPIPVIFNISSWGQKEQSMEQWLIEKLKEIYQVPKTLSKSWMEQEQLILLLDGLDEIGTGLDDEKQTKELRNACVRDLNKFIATYNNTEIVISSRFKDYEALTERLRLSSAISIQTLSKQQVSDVVTTAGTSLTGLKKLLPEDQELEKFAQLPLNLNLMTRAYQDWSAKDLIKQLRSTKNRQQHLFDTYIKRMLLIRSGRLWHSDSAKYPQNKVIQWLSWLAQTMVHQSQTVFLIEKMQPSLLQSQDEKLSYQISNFLLGWLCFTLCLSLSFGWIPGLILGIFGGVITGLSTKITFFEQMSWSWQRAQSRIMDEVSFGLIFGLFFGLIFGLSDGLSFGLFFGIKEGLIFGLICGLICGLIFGLRSGLGSEEVEQKTIPNQGIWNSAKNAIIFGLIVGLIIGLIFGMSFGLREGLSFGLKEGFSLGGLVGLLVGGVSCIQHFNLRLILYHQDRMPWNYARFLDYAAERQILKKVGSGYIFYHHMLKEHLAHKNQVSSETASLTFRQTPQSFAQINTRIQDDSENIEQNVAQLSNTVENQNICSICNHDNPINGKFCIKCGNKLFEST
ncbi:NACHT domain-containing protein [Pleurocapsa sp. PCC 7319]|uniref:NACHT domain-containing protein n=1 Tax=Pleurocapsa sp. PCC 7319 TaxID=118161 RepID=UPI000360C635|nr:NACHT domain-containing protein [Pleurocapsa sp. PCC 7319]